MWLFGGGGGDAWLESSSHILGGLTGVGHDE